MGLTFASRVLPIQHLFIGHPLCIKPSASGLGIEDLKTLVVLNLMEQMV